MATSRYWVEDILTGIVLTQDLPLNGVQVEDHLNRPGALRASLPVDHDMATEELLDEGRRAIYWERDGKIEFGGPLWRVERGIGSRNLSLDVTGWLGYWDHRDIWRDRSFTNTDQFSIFQTLVNDAQDEAYSTALGGPGADSDLGITVTWDALSGVLRDRTEDYRDHQAKNLGEALRQLAGVEDGFDYAMQYAVNLSTNRITKTIKLWYPRRGRTTNYLFEFQKPGIVRRDETLTVGGEPLTVGEEILTLGSGSVQVQAPRGNISRWGITRDASHLAWRARGWGDGVESARLRSQVVDETKRGVYPPLDVAFKSSAGITEQATLDERTAGDLARVNQPTRLPAVEINPAMFPRWGDWELGDTVLLRIDDGYGSIGLDVPVSARVVGWQMQPKSDRPVLILEET